MTDERELSQEEIDAAAKEFLAELQKHWDNGFADVEECEGEPCEEKPCPK